jgi:hypothetical protein
MDCQFWLARLQSGAKWCEGGTLRAISSLSRNGDIALIAAGLDRSNALCAALKLTEVISDGEAMKSQLAVSNAKFSTISVASTRQRLSQ